MIKSRDEFLSASKALVDDIAADLRAGIVAEGGSPPVVGEIERDVEKALQFVIKFGTRVLELTEYVDKHGKEVTDQLAFELDNERPHGQT